MQIQEQVAGIRSRTDDLLHVGEDVLVEVSKLVLTSDWRSLNLRKTCAFAAFATLLQQRWP
jgi:hypothetical protein